MTFSPAARPPLLGLVLTLVVHALAFTVASRFPLAPATATVRPADAAEIVWLNAMTPTAEASPPARQAPPVPPAPRPEAAPAVPRERPTAVSGTAAQIAPPAPTAEEWAFASRYTLKNSKAYRHTWGQQVRSMMGPAVEGPDQGMVRFRVEIAPDGTLTRLDTLWTTSPVAERLARKAVEAMPRWPPTPTGRPLVFERTIAFTPFGIDDPPVYKNDCLPDPPEFRNPFSWDGRSAPSPSRPQAVERQDPQALEDCLRQLPKDSIDAESARDRRLIDQWGSPTLNR